MMSVGGRLDRLLFKRMGERRVPMVRQFDQNDCGPACLLTVLRWHGGDASLGTVRELARTDSSGTSLRDLAVAARAMGLKATGVKASFDDLEAVQLPCIAHLVTDLGLQHYVVIERLRNGGVIIGDPASGERFVPRRQFLTQWHDGILLLLTPTASLSRDPQPAAADWIRTKLSPSAVLLGQVVFTGVAYTALGLVTAYGIQELIDTVIPRRDETAVLTLGGALLLLQVIRSFVGVLRSRFLIAGSARAANNIAGEFLSHVFRQPLRFFRHKSRGDFTTRLQDILRVQGTLTRIFGSIVIDVTMILGAFIYLGVLAPRLLGAVIVAIGVLGVWFARATHSLELGQRTAMQLYAVVESQFLNAVDGAADVLGYRVGTGFADQSRRAFGAFQEESSRLGDQKAHITQIAEVCGGLVLIGSLVYGALLVIDDHLRIGAMMAAYSLIAQAVPALLRIVDGASAIQTAKLGIHRLLDGGVSGGERADGITAGGAQALVVGAFAQLTDGVRLANVSYSWPRGLRLLSNISVTLPVGTLSAICGDSGSGKSTLGEIIAGRTVPTEGSVLADGQPFCDGQTGDIRVAIVREEVKIFNGSLQQNILLGRPSIQLDDVVSAAKRLGTTSLLERMPRGLATYVGERGVMLSAGERQVVGLLRAIVGDPALLVADECLNALDASTLTSVLGALKDYAQTHVVVIISHHPTVIAMADRVHWLADGQLHAAKHGLAGGARSSPSIARVAVTSNAPRNADSR